MANDQRFMKKIASSGGKATLKKYSNKYFQMLANKRWLAQRNKKNDEMRAVIKQLHVKA